MEKVGEAASSPAALNGSKLRSGGGRITATSSGVGVASTATARPSPSSPL
ncbi:MAG: hypothetical protein WKH64_09175 [Chloroflexia bacterium]